MKVKVRRSFRDSGTGKIARIGEELEYEEFRAQSLANSGFVSLLEEPESVEEAEPVDGDPKEKNEFDPFPEKDEDSGPKKRGRKPKD